VTAGGPAYAGGTIGTALEPIYVTGSDPYRQTADALACE
jgi:hypothetical protein